jgi:hypothetical protein
VGSLTAPIEARRELYATSSTEEPGHQAQGLLTAYHLTQDGLTEKIIAAEYAEFTEMFREQKGIKALLEHQP